jgi:hypothetical protein
VNASPNPYGGGAVAPPPGPMVAPPPIDRAAELKGVRLSRAAALTSLLGLILAWIGPVAVIVVTGVEVHFGGFHVGSGAASVSAFEGLLGVVVAGAALSLVALILYLLSFNVFRKLTPGFGGPFALLIIGLLGLFLIVIGILLVLEDFFQAAACAASGASSSCVDLTQLGGAVLAIFGGLFFAFLGWIGLLIGIYRIGKRYGSTITKVGAILSIIPLVGLIAPILIFIGMQQVVHRLESQSPGLY